MKNAYIIHGGGEGPDSCWFPWAKRKLEQRGYRVSIPLMPERSVDIQGWVDVLESNIEPGTQNIIVGHSRGCQAILRYLQDVSGQFSGVYLVAPFTKLKFDDWRAKSIEHWLNKPIRWAAVKKSAKTFVALFSDNDEIVDISQAKVFETNLGAKVVLEHNKGHYDAASKITELPSLLVEIERYSA